MSPLFSIKFDSNFCLKNPCHRNKKDNVLITFYSEIATRTRNNKSHKVKLMNFISVW